MDVKDVSTLGIKVHSDDVRKATRDLDKLGKSGGMAERSVMGLKRAVGYLAVALGAVKIASFIKDTALLGARYDTLGVVMKVVGTNAGYAGEQMERFAKGLQKAGISMIESRANITKMAQAQLDLSKATDLARVAQDAAVIGNVNSSEAFARLIHGIQSAQTEVLRTIGINVRFEDGYKRLAQALGANANELTEAQKAQSRMNQVLEYGKRISGTYESAMTTAGKKLSSFTRYVEDFKVKMGAAFGPATATLVDRFTDMMKQWQVEIAKPENQQALKEMANDIADIVGHFAEIAKLLPNIIQDLKIFFDLTTLKSFRKSVGQNRALNEAMMKFQEQQRQPPKLPEMTFGYIDENDPEFNAILKAELGYLPKVIKATKKKFKPVVPEPVPTGGGVQVAPYDAEKAFEQNARNVELMEALERAHKDLNKAVLPEHERAVADIIEEYDNWKKVTTELAAANVITWEEAQEKSDALTVAMENDLKRISEQGEKTFGEDMKNAVSGWAAHFSATLSDAIFKGEDGFKGLLDAFLDMLGQMVIQKQLVEPLLTSFGFTASADGNVFQNGRVMAFASGGVVTGPTFFPMANGVGLMGEAGPEAVMPLKRGADGKLGVQAEGSGSNTFNVTIIAADSKSFDDMVKRNPKSITSVFIDAIQKGDRSLKNTIKSIQ